MANEPPSGSGNVVDTKADDKSSAVAYEVTITSDKTAEGAAPPPAEASGESGANVTTIKQTAMAFSV